MTTEQGLASPRELGLLRYFRAIPTPPDHREAVRAMVGGGALVLVGLVLGTFASTGLSRLLIGGALLGGGGVLVARGSMHYLRDKYAYEKDLAAAFPRSTDDVVDLWLADGLARLRAHSLERLGLAEEDCEQVDVPPILSPIIWLKPGVPKENVVWQIGRDRRARFGIYGIAYLWFADNRLGIFRCDYNLIKDVALSEEIHQFHYQDIASVAMRETTSSLTLPTGVSLTSQQELTIAVANGSYFSITVDAEQLKRLTGAEHVPTSGAEKALSALRLRLEEKKARLLRAER